MTIAANFFGMASFFGTAAAWPALSASAGSRLRLMQGLVPPRASS